MKLSANQIPSLLRAESPEEEEDETCKDVAKTAEKQVAYPVCNDVPEQKCVDVPRQ